MVSHNYAFSMAFRAFALLLLVTAVTGCGQKQYSSPPESKAAAPAFTRIAPGELHYYPPGEYLRRGYPAVPPRDTIRFDHELVIMTRQISQAEYAACVDDGACTRLDKSLRDHKDTDLPVVGVSWRDATNYAQWYSQKTGESYRLPTYVEWVHAAGSAYKEDIILDEFDVDDPAQRWLAEYALETQRKAVVDGALRRFGGFGANDAGVKDMAGNVWDWTDTCHVRLHLGSADSDGTVASENCGVRVVAGPHRSYIPDFIRDAKGGACSVGVPPSNLGFRLIRDEPAQGRIAVPPLRERLGIG